MAVVDRHGVVDHQDGSGGVQLNDADGGDRLDISQARAAIATRRLGTIDLDDAVIHRHPRQSGHHMLHHFDDSRSVPEGSASWSWDDVVGMREDGGASRQVGPYEDNARSRLGWAEPEHDIATMKEADTVDFRVRGDRGRGGSW